MTEKRSDFFNKKVTTVDSFTSIDVFVIDFYNYSILWSVKVIIMFLAFVIIMTLHKFMVLTIALAVILFLMRHVYIVYIVYIV